MLILFETKHFPVNVTLSYIYLFSINEASAQFKLILFVQDLKWHPNIFIALMSPALSELMCHMSLSCYCLGRTLDKNVVKDKPVLQIWDVFVINDLTASLYLLKINEY